MPVQPIPAGYHTIIPYLLARDASTLLEFIKKAFDAKETHETMRSPDGKIMHAELGIGDSRIMLAEACGEFAPMTSMLHVYVPDCDATYRQALAAGGTSVREPANQFYGDRSGGVKDPAGNMWFIATHIEDVTPEEIARRAQAAPPPG